MKYDFLRRGWLERHGYNLKLFLRDLDLINNNHYKIYLAIDFYDIQKYCFPFAEYSRNRSEIYRNSSNFRKTFYNNYAAGTAMFFFDAIYQKPNLLLPPYITELDEFLLFLKRDSGKFVFRDDEILDVSGIIESFKYLTDKDGQLDYDRFLNYINRNSPDLIYYSSDLFKNNLTKFFNLLRTYFVEDTEFLFNDETPQVCFIDSIIFQLNNDQLSEYSEIKETVWKLRQRPSKIPQNDRDAEAIYTIYRINKMYNKHKKAFILVSSAPHLNKLQYEGRGHDLEIDIGTRKFFPLRGLDFFSSILLAIANFQLHNMSKVNISEIDLKSLRKSVDNDIMRLEDYLAYESRVGGVLLTQLRDQLSTDVFGLSRLTSNLDLALLIDDFVPADEKSGKDVKMNIDLLSKFYDPNQKEIAKTIHEAFSDPKFRDKLLNEYINLEVASLRHFLRITQSNQKTLNVTLFNIPLELDVEDDISKNMIQRVIQQNITGKREIRKTGTLSSSTAVNIYNLLNELVDRSERLGNNERLILWQLVFLYLGKHNHADEIYNIFSTAKLTDHMTESIYLYAISFVRKMRMYNITNKQHYHDIIKLCKNNSYIYVGKVDKKVNLELLNLNNIQIKNNRGEMVNLPFTSDCTVLNNKTKIFYNACKSSNKYTYIAKKSKNEIGIYYVDFRFLHLELQISNRYFNDFGCLHEDNLDKLENDLKTIFIPTAELADPDYYIAIASDYSYLLSLDKKHETYLTNLIDSMDLMLELQERSLQTDNLYWGYVRNYILGDIYYNLAITSDSNNKGDLIGSSLIYLTRSLNELPDQAEHLRNIVKKKIDLCNNQFYLLKN